MKRLTTSALAMIMFGASAVSAAAVEVWQGDLFIIKATADCRPTWTQNEWFHAVLRPNGLEDNGTNTLLALFRPRYAARYVFSGALAGNGTYSLRHINSVAGGGMGAPFSGNYSGARVRPVPRVGRQTLVVQVRLSDFANIAGCTALLQGSLGLRPDT